MTSFSNLSDIRHRGFLWYTLDLRSIEYTRSGGRIIKIKLPELERKPDGSLYRMTPKQFRTAKRLIRESCCNYDSGNCLVLDDGESFVCPQSIS